KTGRLAVTDLSNPTGGEPGNVVIYPSPSGQPAAYSDPHVNEPLFCTFDGKGNLYVVAYDSGFHPVLSKLPNGAQNFVIFNVSGGTMNVPGGLQWVGTQLLLGDNYDPKTKVYQLSVSGSTATVVNAIAMSKSQSIAEFTKFGTGASAALVAPDYDGNSLV